MNKDKTNLTDNEIILTNFKYMLNLINASQMHNNAMAVSQFLMTLIREYSLTLPRADQILRDFKSRIYLLGLPLHVYNSNKTQLFLMEGRDSLNPPIGDYVARLPDHDKFLEHSLWVCMNGIEDVQNTLKKFELNQNDIDLTLEQTGFLYFKEKGN